MTARRSSSIVALAAIASLSGCHKHAKIVALPPPPPAPAMVSVPPPTHPSEPVPKVPLAKVEPVTPELPRRKHPRFKPVPAPPPAPPPTVAVAQPEPIGLGQLTAGGEADNSATRPQTEDLLRAQQKRLDNISSAVVALHTQQIEQARVYLRQADEAWKKLDIEGTRTLATKAKVLLDEVLG